MANADISKIIPVSKNGKFFGYADERQVKRTKSLKPFDKAKAAAEVALREEKESAKEVDAQIKLDEKNKALAEQNKKKTNK